MRRAFSILLLAIFAAGPLAAMLPGSEDALLPACCRRDGAHHCGMTAAMAAAAQSAKPAASAPSHCPYYPGQVFALLAPVRALAASTAALAPAQTAAHLAPAAPEQAFAGADSNHAGRGPPASILV